MKKLILISLNEFLVMGGTLKKGMIFYRDSTKPMDPTVNNSAVLNSLHLGELIDTEQNEGGYFLLKSNSWKSFPIIPQLAWVMIEIDLGTFVKTGGK